MDKSEISNRLEFRKAALEELRRAYIELVSGRVASYSIGSRNLTRFDITKLRAEIEAMEKECDALIALIKGGSRRKAVGVIPRDT